jgi:hypothetical protein
MRYILFSGRPPLRRLSSPRRPVVTRGGRVAFAAVEEVAEVLRLMGHVTQVLIHEEGAGSPVGTDIDNTPAALKSAADQCGR